ncbi:MAG: hypothetical protein RLY86_1404 [Pseudomonadota bacterium]|jgi:di/tricarboxylate transporter
MTPDGLPTTDQIAISLILIGALVVFIWDRWRYDVVALATLFIAVIVGVVPAGEAFSGFSDPAVVTVAAVLVLSSAIRSSGVLDIVLRPVLPRLTSPDVQVLVLSLLVATLSAFMNNVGALAIVLPVALRVAQRTGRPAAALLMPLAFASLLGGTITLIGTPPNILISGIREDFVGEGFGMFDFAPVGLAITVAGLAVMTVCWRLIPMNRRGTAGEEVRFRIEDYTTEVRVPALSPYVGRSVSQLEFLGEGDVTVAAIFRERFRRYVPHGHSLLTAEDILLLEGDPIIVKRLVDQARLELVGDSDVPHEPSGDGYGVVEAVVTTSSPLVGTSPSELGLRRRFGLNLLAIGRHDRRAITRLRSVRLRPGDVLVLQGRLAAMPDTLAELGCLPLAERNLKLGRQRWLWLPVVVMAVAVLATVLNLVPVSIAFLGAVLVLLMAGALPLKEAYNSVEWPVIILLGALIPVSEALRTTGATDLIAGGLAGVTAGMPPIAALAVVMLGTMMITPILNNAATVLVMAPIGVGLAQNLGLSPDAFLMAVAIGASCDFLTPIGHQSNTLVMGPAGYRFGDYWRLGLPVSLTVVAIALPLIAYVFPLR